LYCRVYTQECGAIPWENDYVNDKCHMWRYGSDLSPVWGSGNKNDVATRILSGGGRSGVGDVIEFASGIFAYNWRAVTGPGAFNDPDFLVVGCPTDRPCEGFSQKGQIPLTGACTTSCHITSQCSAVQCSAVQCSAVPS
jgi:hypothetical protein